MSLLHIAQLYQEMQEALDDKEAQIAGLEIEVSGLAADLVDCNAAHDQRAMDDAGEDS